MHPFIRFCLAAAMLALFVDNANALSGPACTKYADEAVKAGEEAAKLGCGFGNHPRWGTSREAHNRFCRTASKETIDFETLERRNSMFRCGRCAEYGATANAQARENKIFHCGGTGAKWGTGDGHMRWCMSINYKDSQWGMAAIAGLVSNDWGGTSLWEQSQREKTLQQCRAKYTKAQIDACNAYATEAVKQAEANQAKKCNSEGPRFSKDREQHFSWCIGQIETDGVKMTLLTKQEQDAREAINNTCRRVLTLGKKRDKNMLQPIPSTGGSPFGGKKSIAGSGPDKSAPAEKSSLSISKRGNEKSGTSGGFDAAKPSNSNSGMDRLTGDTQLPSSSGNVVAKDRRVGGRSPANAGISAGPKPGIAPALTSKPNSIPDYGGCATCGKPAADKFAPR
jgi:hypothetical protein